MLLENLAKSTGGKVYKELDVFYETLGKTGETHHGEKGNSKDNLEFLILQSIAQAEEKGRYAFFQKTAELVSSSNSIEIQSVKEKLSVLISEGYLKQENRTSSKNNPIRTIEFTPSGHKLLREFATQ
jgi:predicted transcriptional regulator